MKVYVVTEGEYSAYCIVGIFSTKEKAMAFLEKQGRWKYGLNKNEEDIEEYELDGMQYSRYVQVHWDPQDDFIGYDEANAIYPERLEIHPWSKRETFIFYLPVIHPAFLHKDETQRDKHCLKIAHDRYAQYKAKRAGI